MLLGIKPPFHVVSVIPYPLIKRKSSIIEIPRQHKTIKYVILLPCSTVKDLCIIDHSILFYDFPFFSQEHSILVNFPTCVTAMLVIIMYVKAEVKT